MRQRDKANTMNSLDEARQPLNLGVHEEDIPGIFAEVLRYLTPERLSRKLEAVAAGLEQSGPFYREFYLRPLNALWLGMRQVEGSAGGDFRPDRIEADVLPSIHTAALIAEVLPSLPRWKRDEFRSRLLDKAGGDVPALVELTAASRLVRMGAKIEWVPESPGKQTCELVGEFEGQEFELECKAKTVDVGRRMERPAIYQFADELLAKIPELTKGDPTCLEVLVDTRFPREKSVQTELVKRVLAGVKGENAVFHDERPGVNVERLTPTGDELVSIVDSKLEGFEHRAIVLDKFKRPRLLIRFRSRRPDRMINAIEEDLRKALKQFSGERPGLIVCYVPEVESFEGVQSQSTATTQMIDRVASRPDARNLVSISFISDAQIFSTLGLTETNIESLKYVTTRFKDSRLAIL